jgi:hypothetical protein
MLPVCWDNEFINVLFPIRQTAGTRSGGLDEGFAKYEGFVVTPLSAGLKLECPTWDYFFPCSST